MWILKLKSVNSEVKSVDSEAKKCGFVKKNSHFFYCLLPKVWFKSNKTLVLCIRTIFIIYILYQYHSGSIPNLHLEFYTHRM